MEQGDELEVFLYRDSRDRMIATVREPLVKLGETALLKVVQTGKIGAFWTGVWKRSAAALSRADKKVMPGEEVLAALYIDKSGRLCATMKVYHYLKTGSPYVIGDEVEGRVYQVSDNFGIFVAVDDRYSGLVPHQEAQGNSPLVK